MFCPMRIRTRKRSALPYAGGGVRTVPSIRAPAPANADGFASSLVRNVLLTCENGPDSAVYVSAFRQSVFATDPETIVAVILQIAVIEKIKFIVIL